MFVYTGLKSPFKLKYPNGYTFEFELRMYIIVLGQYTEVRQLLFCNFQSVLNGPSQLLCSC